MGMFDWYQPDPPLICPLCGTKLEEWQGKDGPCLLFHWKQGHRNPAVHSKVSSWKPDHLELYLLPEKFEIYSYDCERHQPITALGKAPREVWTITEVMGHGRFDDSYGRPRWRPHSNEDQ